MAAFSLDILDAESGHVVQTWQFDGSTEVVQIGRSADSDLVISNPYVSRSHACLRPSGESWELSAISRTGVLVEGKRVGSVMMEDGLVFRLADQGPWLRYRSEATSEQRGGETMTFDSTRISLLILDDQQLEREVQQIAESDYFRELKRRTALMRSQGSNSKTGRTTEN